MLDQQFLSPRQVAEITGIEPTTLANWRWAGRGPSFVRLGRSIRYPASELYSWIESRRQSTGS